MLQTRHLRALTSLFVLGLATALAGCGNDNVAEPDDGLSPPMFVSGQSAGLFDASAGVSGLDASVQLNRRGCVILVPDHVNADALIIWPKGTTRNPDSPTTFDVSGYGKLSIGDHLQERQFNQGAGGPTSADYAEDFPRMAERGADQPVAFLDDFQRHPS